MPIWAPGLLIIRNDPLLIIFFLVLNSINYLLWIQDAIMMSRGKSSFVLWRNVACNVPPLFLLIPFVKFVGGYEAIFMAFGIPNIVVGLTTSLFFMPGFIEGYSFFGRINKNILFETMRFGLINHGSNLLWESVNYILPIVAINVVSNEHAGYFYINWQVAGFLFIIPKAVSMSLFIVGSRKKEKLNDRVVRSLLMICGLSIPVIGFIWNFGDRILRLFGEGFVEIDLLRILVISIIPFTLNNIFLVILRIKEKLIGLISFSAFTIICVLVSVLSFSRHLGILGIGYGWLFGQILAAVLVFLVTFQYFYRSIFSK
jgi:O-antigen/teichoic acid export membrane protein